MARKSLIQREKESYNPHHRNSVPTRFRRYCFSIGRSRANYQDFGLSGHILREMVHAYLLAGAIRSIW
ncbi:hypothetical protein Pfo_027298 [Paulownia fortunei]|nr:hypothetical protein Pfo_027298 [Paulownia fortunei]